MSWRDGGKRAWFAPNSARLALACLLSLIGVLVLGVESTRAASGDIDLSAYVTNGPVNAVAHDDVGGSTYIGGNFTMVGPRIGSGMVLSGSGSGAPNPASFPEVAGGRVQSAAPDGSGGWYIGGNFDFVGTELHPWIAHINPDGTVDSGWNPDADGAVRALAVSGSTVYAGGDFTTIGGQLRSRIAALDAATGSATSWNPGADDIVRALDVSGGTVYVGGEFTTLGGQSRNHLGALDEGTGSDTGWNPDAENGFVNALAVSGATVFVGGSFDQIGTNNQARESLAGIDAATGAASSWDPSPNSSVLTLAEAGGTVYAGGSFQFIASNTVPEARNRLAAWDAGTGIDTGWDPGANGTVRALTVSGTSVYVGGDFSTAGGQTRSHAASLDAGTGNATAWDPNTDDVVFALAADGTDVYVGGDFVSAGPDLADRSNIARLNPDGTLDTSWDPGADGEVLALALQGSRLFVGGDFSTLDGQPRTFLGALDAGTGAAVGGWAPSVGGGDVLALAISGNTLYVGGGFLTLGSVGPYIGSVDAVTGAVNSGWDPSDGEGPVTALAVSADGNTVYAGGAFEQLGGLTRSNIAALDAASGAATSWDPGASLFGPEVLVVSGATVYAGGPFSTIGHLFRSNIASLDPSDPNSDATDWDPSASSTVEALAVSNGLVYAGGAFATIGGQTRNGLAALNVDSGLATTWDPDAIGGVSALAVSSDTAYAGGSFTSVGGHAAARFAQIEAALPDLSVSPPDKNFGNQLVGTSSASQTFTVTNTGVTDLVINDVSLIGANSAQFTKLNDQCDGSTVNPSDTCTVDVTFDPTSVGSKGASLRLTDATAGSSDVQLAGTGIAPDFSVSPAATDFGDQSLGTPSSQTFTVTNFGSADLNITDAAVVGTDADQFAESNDLCSGTAVGPSGTCTVDVTFTPTSLGSKSASLQFSDDATGSPHDVSLAGTGTGVPPGVSVSPSSKDFGNRLIATSSASQTFTVTNTGGTTLNITNADVVGTDFDQFVESNDQCTGTAVNPSETCTVAVAFSPTTVGAKSANLQLTDDAVGSPHDVPLTGTGTTTGPDASLTPPTHDFGSRQVSTGASTSQVFTLQSIGGDDVVISSVSLIGGDASQFLVTANACNGATVTPSSTCTVDVAFLPTAAGSKVAQLRVADNAPGSPQTSSLSGNGTSPPATNPVPTPTPTPAPGPKPMETTIMKSPKKTTTKRDATFKFASDVAGALFECKLDKKAFGRCASPAKLKTLKPGKHVFQVRAVDAVGNADRSPASFRWTVKKP